MTKVIDKDISNRKLLGVFTLEQVIGFIFTSITITAATVLLYSTFANAVENNTASINQTKRDQKEQKQDIEEIKESVSSVENDVTEIKGDQKRLNDKMDLVLDILQGKFDKKPSN